MPKRPGHANLPDKGGPRFFVPPHPRPQGATPRAEGRWRWVSTGHTTDAGVWCDAFGICYGYSTSIYGHPDITGGVTVRF